MTCKLDPWQVRAQSDAARAQADREIQRLTDEVAHLTRERDLWRERAKIAEVDADVMALSMAVCEGHVAVTLAQPQQNLVAARLREAFDRVIARGRVGGAP